jgi:hypothetical protein
LGKDSGKKISFKKGVLKSCWEALAPSLKGLQCVSEYIKSK